MRILSKDQAVKQIRGRKLLGMVGLVLSMVLLVGMSLVYSSKGDGWAAVRFYPAWCWAVLGVILALVGRGAGKWMWIIVVLVWVVYVPIFVVEVESLVRGWRAEDFRQLSTQRDEYVIRVVSMNCAGGQLAAAREVLPYEPDVVLLQEAPKREEVEALAAELFGEYGAVVWSPDTVIMVRGDAEEVEFEHIKEVSMTQARVKLFSGKEVEVMCVHLAPPTSGINLFSPRVWREHTEDRQKRRGQLAKIVEQVEKLEGEVSIIVGGDFNVAGGDNSLSGLGVLLRDGFDEEGYGWGDTAINEFPLWRVDQIWISENLEATGVFTLKTKNSDHRMVIGDYVRAGTVRLRQTGVTEAITIYVVFGVLAGILMVMVAFIEKLMEKGMEFMWGRIRRGISKKR